MAAVSAWAIVAIIRRYSARGALPLQEINGVPNYNLGPVKFTAFMAMFWGIAGFTVGVIIASQLAFPALNLGEWVNFGRLRPLHTSAVIFAFGGNVLIATSFYVVQRTSPARLAGGTGAVVRRSGATTCSSCSPAPATCWASPRARNTPSRNGTPTCWLTVVWVAYLLVFLGTML
ncbi:MAG: cbb3-type cytochrome c oxidase subunit I [Rhodopseudomonas palustris]|nr:cbb3-type cytochrome c oxidase subunit I [Rhodopseudomonas palustris]